MYYSTWFLTNQNECFCLARDKMCNYCCCNLKSPRFFLFNPSSPKLKTVLSYSNVGIKNIARFQAFFKRRDKPLKALWTGKHRWWQLYDTYRICSPQNNICLLYHSQLGKYISSQDIVSKGHCGVFRLESRDFDFHNNKGYCKISITFEITNKTIIRILSGSIQQLLIAAHLWNKYGHFGKTAMSNSLILMFPMTQRAWVMT